MTPSTHGGRVRQNPPRHSFSPVAVGEAFQGLSPSVVQVLRQDCRHGSSKEELLASTFITTFAHQNLQVTP